MKNVLPLAILHHNAVARRNSIQKAMLVKGAGKAVVKRQKIIRKEITNPVSGNRKNFKDDKLVFTAAEFLGAGEKFEVTLDKAGDVCKKK